MMHPLGDLEVHWLLVPRINILTTPKRKPKLPKEENVLFGLTVLNKSPVYVELP